MNVSTLIITKENAQAKLDQYRSIKAKQRVREDDKLESLYASVSKGARVINIAAAFKQTGLNELKQPRLAIARADWPDVFCSRWSMIGPNYGAVFTDRPSTWRTFVRDIHIPLDFPSEELFQSRLESPVPHIPPECRGFAQKVVFLGQFLCRMNCCTKSPVQVI